MNRAGRAVEGWAVVRYSVLADGETANVRVVATAPSEIERRPIEQAVRDWRFSPAKDGNEAVDWHNMESLVTFQGDGAPAAPSEAFTAEYQAIRAILEGEEPVDFAAAWDMNEELLEESATRASEIGFALTQRALIAIGMADWQSAYENIRLATDPRLPTLTGEDLFVGLQLRLQIANQLGHAQDALETHGRIVSRLGPDQQAPFEGMADLLREKLATEAELKVSGRIGEDPWRFSPGRRIFTIAGVEGGQIEDIGVECDRRRATLEYQADVEWQLPARWGSCTLLVDGSPGTAFVFYEFLEPASEE